MAKKTKASAKSKVDPGIKALLEREPGLEDDAGADRQDLR